MDQTDPRVKSVNVTASGIVKSGGGYVYGVIVNSHSSGTLKLWNNTSAALSGSINPQSEGLIHDTITFAVGPGIYTFPAPIPFTVGCYATVGGTLNCQVVITKE